MALTNVAFSLNSIWHNFIRNLLPGVSLLAAEGKPLTWNLPSNSWPSWKAKEVSTRSSESSIEQKVIVVLAVVRLDQVWQPISEAVNHLMYPSFYSTVCDISSRHIHLLGSAVRVVGQMGHRNKRMLQSFMRRDSLIPIKMQQPFQEVHKHHRVLSLSSALFWIDLDLETISVQLTQSLPLRER